MPDFLEATMLVCFGLSWPISVWKNIKSHTAKNMSMRFNLLLIFGYIAGILAKCYLHAWNYVLAIYVLNLVIVSCNVLVYYRNKKYDAKDELLKNFAV